MEELTIEELIAHCDRQLAQRRKGTIHYREHEAVREYLLKLRDLMGVDVVKVVRCNRCIHRVGAFCNHPDVCGIVRVTETHYCGFGEEK